VRANARALRSSSTDAERLIWSKLRNRRFAGRKFRRQHPIGPFVADFACVEAHLVIELDGGQHFESEAITADARRSTFFHLQGFTTLRFTNREVLAETESVLTSIHQWLDLHHPHPSPLLQAGEGVNEGTP
jgi:very-short-patch-repair endonuclease